jgi:TrmH family RNA methyltransferase
MLNKNVIKDIQSLIHKKNRVESGLFIAEGPKIVNELLTIAPERVEAIYAIPEWQSTCGPQFSSLIHKVEAHELEKLSALQTPNQVLIVMQQFPAAEPESLKGLTLYLDAIQDPGNFGTILRIADWFGIQHVICSNGCADLYNPKVVQSTMASIARINVWYDEEENWLAKQQLPVMAATLDGQSIYSHEKIPDGILLIGNESKGVRNEFLKLATQKLTIPKIGAAESLNAAVATGIILSHLTAS